MITNKLKYLTKLFAYFVTRLLFAYSIGLISSILFIVLGFFILTNNIGSGLGHSGVYLFLVASITNQPIAAILFYLLVIASPYLIFVFSTNFAATKIISKVIKDNTDKFFLPYIDKLTDKYKNVQPNFIKKSGDFALEKTRMIHDIKNSSDNKVIKIILTYVLKKIHFDELDLSNDKVSFEDVLKSLMLNKLDEFAQSSPKGIYYLILVQFICLLILYFIKY